MNEIPDIINIPGSTKGPSLVDAGYVYAPYVPIYKTPIVLDPNSFLTRKGIMTRYGKKILQQGSQYYGKISITKDETCDTLEKKEKHRSITEDWEVSKLD